MKGKPELPRGLDGPSATRALMRARQLACEVAARTGTPLVIYRDGKVEFVKVTAAPTSFTAENDFAADPKS